MEKIDREYLQRGQTIELSAHRDGRAPETYRVLSVVGEGGSTVCYEAARERDGHVESGKLKEFYPLDAVQGDRFWYYSLKRRENGQLTPGTGTVRRFDDMCAEYVRTYHELEGLMADDTGSRVLKNYIQYGEVLYVIGVPGVCRGSVYIWSPGAMGQGFDEYLADVRREPAAAADFKLHDILQTVYTLVDCIKAMHTAGLLHLDIKPSNFLVHYDSDMKINGNRISLFDINTLHRMGSGLPVLGGTAGYCAPEVLRGRADNRSDIYSVGAMLFEGIIISDNVPAGGFDPIHYESIPRLVRDSKLIRSSGSNSNVRLMSCLAGILQKCLARNPRKRFQSCEELLLEMEKALVQLRMYTVNPLALGANEQMAIVKTDVRGEAEPTVVIQKLLYQHPLYESVPENQKDIHALVVGSGTYGQKFIDITLQTAQMSGVRLKISALSDNPGEDGGMYLQFRPELPRFVSVRVDGRILSAPAQTYGELEFRSLVPGADVRDAQFRVQDAVTNGNIVRSVAGEAQYDYVFVALGQDDLNRSVAKLFREAGVACPVCYVSEAIVSPQAEDERLYPACVNEPITASAIAPEMEQMAFNAHCMWLNNRDVDMNAEFERFRQNAYQYASNMAFVLSIKYKLHAIGIELEEDPQRAAEQFEDALWRKDFDADEARKFRTLVALEQRRWVLDRVCDGWRAPKITEGQKAYADLAERGMTQDRAAKIHPCIVFSGEDMPLMTAEYQRDDHAKWDAVPIDPALDELDRMSLELHQRFSELAERLRATRPLESGDMEMIRRMIADAGEAPERAFRQYRFCLKNILDGVESYARRHDSYRDALLAALDGLEADVRRRIEERLRLVKQAFFPAIERCMHRDYKRNNCLLVENIPYILTRRYRASIAMAFEDGVRQNGKNEAVFANVASATTLAPKKICYLYWFDGDCDEELLLRKLDGVMNYFDRRAAHIQVEMLVACSRSVRAHRMQRLQEGLEARMQPQRGTALADYRVYVCRDEEEAAQWLLAQVQSRGAEVYDGSTQLFESRFENGAFAQAVHAAGIAYFEFDWRGRRFRSCRGCRDLKLVRQMPSLRIGDMLALMNAADVRVEVPELAEDYRALWDIYAADVEAWNDLCADMGAYERSRQPLAVIPANENAPKEHFVRMMPEYTQRGLQRIVRELVRMGVAGSDSVVVPRMSDACMLELTVSRAAWQAMQAMLDMPHQLLNCYNAQVQTQDADGTVCAVICNNAMDVQALSLTGDPAAKICLLEKLQAAQCIGALRREGSEVSFRYTSAQFKRLLTDPGAMLQVYTYYEALRSGRFDDVACGYAFRWQEGGVMSELACVMTKGFSSILVDCGIASQENCYRLHSVAERFGIGAHKVLLEVRDGIRRDAALQRSRGEQLDIVILSGTEDMENIGEVLNLLSEEK